MPDAAAFSGTNIVIALNAVLAAIDADEPKVLCVRRPEGLLSLPYGPFDPVSHRTLELGLRDWVTRQTHVPLGYVEQLYTFGDKGRETPAAAFADAPSDLRLVSVGYLALASEPAIIEEREAQWRSFYDFFPWEDWRSGEPIVLRERIIRDLDDWIETASSKRDRLERERRRDLAFGLSQTGWEEERALERYELMYEAALVEEAWRDRKGAPNIEASGKRRQAQSVGAPMASDHRRILATAISRLRGKLKYRPIIFELMPDKFTLLNLQRAVEAIVGFELHKQNFRRSVEAGGLVAKTRETAQQASGRPAALFRAGEVALPDGGPRGLTIPRLRRSPSTRSSGG
ncbi:MAG: NAD regulator [Parvularculaceae bacterium]|nr:NAD regulator [Parvularculaceae bacterium]